ncbi:MAG: thiamine pyrophosphate-dependent dehydrogenase E1 component subunit alpha [Sphingomonadaceae bacterium]
MAENRTNDISLEMYCRMLRIRHFDTQAEILHAAGEIPGGVHTYLGQEATGVGACMALRLEDYMLGTHRSHGHPIAKGAELAPLMAELMGKVTGICKGKGGSMHLSDFKVGSLGETSIVGSGMPVAVGAALGSKMQGNDRVSLCFFGDGASNEGAFHEACNLAAVWKLPVIFLCENNLYAVSTPVWVSTSVKNIADRGAAYGMPSCIVDGQDVELVYEAVSEAVSRARAGGGPTLIEAKTYRYVDHAVNMGRETVDRGGEVDEWRKRDPLTLFRKKLIDAGTSEAKLDAIEAEVVADLDAAIQFARESALPTQEEAFDDVFVDRLPVPAYLLDQPEA